MAARTGRLSLADGIGIAVTPMPCLACLPGNQVLGNDVAAVDSLRVAEAEASAWRPKTPLSWPEPEFYGEQQLDPGSQTVREQTRPVGA
jgi:hypothetical protein